MHGKEIDEQEQSQCRKDNFSVTQMYFGIIQNFKTNTSCGFEF